MVRTTITIEDDVATEIARLQRLRDEGLKQTINAVLRAGIAAMTKPVRKSRTPYRTATASLGKPRLKSLDNIDEVLSFGEGEAYR
ncbi:hypothetical protein K2Z84_22955 [Candidatus Binatia bacterium]|jgi:hypothetical protein|nr:hypothetical protein [Candidatus Binatia bacterium]